jgi:hypothetical protein
MNVGFLAFFLMIRVISKVSLKWVFVVPRKSEKKAREESQERTAGTGQI